MGGEADVVVMGGGHNGLAAAAQLAREGLSVTVLEAANRVGGRAVTEEPLLPGFRHSPHANVLIFCDLMPAMDELVRRGLRTTSPEAQLGVAFADARPPVILYRHDLVGRTVASLGAYSKADGLTYRELKRRSAAMGSVIRRGIYAPPNAAWFDEQREAVRRAYGGLCATASLGHRSAREQVDDLFRKPEVRMLFHHLVLECGVALEEPGGDLAFLGLVIWIAGRWRLPLGGMQGVSDTFARAACAAGAQLRTAAPVRRIVSTGGVARGVELQDGSVVTARHAVVAANPILELFDRLVDPEAVSAAEGTELARMARERAGSVATSVFCLAKAPRYRSARHDPSINLCLKTIVGHETLQDVADYAADVAAGLLPRPAGAVRVHSLWDPSQAPEGRHTAAVDSLFPAPPSLDAQTWAQVEQGYPEAFLDVWSRYADVDGSTVLASACDATARFERRMLLRSGPAQYRTSVPRLYICGPGSYPGGGVHGACGHNAAAVVACDLGLADTASSVAAAPARVRSGSAAPA